VLLENFLGAIVARIPMLATCHTGERAQRLSGLDPVGRPRGHL